jgi:hypothetical protein
LLWRRDLEFCCTRQETQTCGLTLLVGLALFLPLFPGVKISSLIKQFDEHRDSGESSSSLSTALFSLSMPSSVEKRRVSVAPPVLRAEPDGALLFLLAAAAEAVVEEEDDGRSCSWFCW